MQTRGRDAICLKSSTDQLSWGSQIRNYVLHPYQNVVDTRTRHSSSQPYAILDGKLDSFLLSAMKEL